MPRRQDLETILLIGSGPIVIGQACEFDYSGTQACRVLREEGPRLDLLIIRPSNDDAELRILLAEVRRDHAGLPVALALFGPRHNEYLTSLRTQVDLLLPNDIRDRDAADSLAKLLRLP